MRPGGGTALSQCRGAPPHPIRPQPSPSPAPSPTHPTWHHVARAVAVLLVLRLREQARVVPLLHDAEGDGRRVCGRAGRRGRQRLARWQHAGLHGLRAQVQPSPRWHSQRAPATHSRSQGPPSPCTPGAQRCTRSAKWQAGVWLGGSRWGAVEAAALVGWMPAGVARKHSMLKPAQALALSPCRPAPWHTAQLSSRSTPAPGCMHGGCEVRLGSTGPSPPLDAWNAPSADLANTLPPPPGNRRCRRQPMPCPTARHAPP